MKPSSLTTASAAVAAVLLAACADQPYYGGQTTSSPSTYESQASSATVGYGYVERIEVVQKNAARNVAGTVIGGIIGGLIGTQIGSGTGQTAATIAGAVGGAVAGNQIEKRSRGANETFRVTVRLDNGGYQTVTQDNITDLRTGDRVRVDGNMVTRY